MSKEKQIEEMAELMCDEYDNGVCRTDGCICNHNCEYHNEAAKKLYEAGYRKQREGEWIVESEHSIRCSECFFNRAAIKMPLDYCPNCGAKMKGGER